MWTRRRLLAAAPALGAGLLARRARADVAPSDRKLVFVFAAGGWDVTRVYAPAFGVDGIDLEADAEPFTVGGLSLVDHPDRPSVRAFFEAWGERALLVNGLLVPSVSHETCHALLFTGSNGTGEPDWATRIAGAQKDRFALPHVGVGSAVLGGDLAELACRLGRDGQLDGLVTGSLVADTRLPGSRVQTLVDAHVAAAAGRLGADARLADFSGSLGRAAELRAAAGTVSFDPGTTLGDQAEKVVDLLARGVSRCATLQVPWDDLRAWDSHSNNDVRQSLAFEELYAGLGALLAALAGTPGTVGASLLDETVVAVVSEMGRTPWLTHSGGKDHWPWTSLLLLGSGVTGSRTVGAFDDHLYGTRVDAGGAPAGDGGALLDTPSFGATLLALLDVAPGEGDAPPWGWVG